MTVRLHFCILTLLVMTLISIQHPVSIVSSDVSEKYYPDLQASKYKEKEDSTHARFKRQAKNESSKCHYNNQYVNLEKTTKEESDRNKRRETEEDDGVMERNQFYKPINEETREFHPVVNFKQDKEGKPYHRIENLLGPGRLSVAKVARSQRQETGGWEKITGPRHDIAGGLQDESHRPENLDNSVDSEYMLTSNSAQRIGRENDEMQELAGISFSPETQETMRKINPLTIGDQVSQMIHDRHCKPKNKPTSLQERRENALPTFRCALAAQHHEDRADSGVPQAADVPKLLAASKKEQPPKIEQKPSSSHDYGFSVYLLGGDQPKSGGNVAHNENQKTNGASNNIEQCKYAIKTDYNKMNSVNVKSPNDELRVEKNPNPNVEFPVYDQDLAFTPDPLHGLLEQHDRIDPVRKEFNMLPLGSSPAFPRHMVHARSTKKKNSKGNGNSSLTKKGNKDGVPNGSEGGDSTVDRSADGDSVGDDSQTPNMEASGDSKNGINKTSCKSWNSAGNGSSADDSVGDDGQTSDVEPFGDLTIDSNKTSCLSWNDNAVGNDTSGCGMSEQTTGETAQSICAGETATPDVETCGDSEMNTNNTCCKSWRDPKSKHKSKLTLT